MNAPDSDRYQQIDRANMNKQLSKLRCPRCESSNVQRDDGTDHPGCFECLECWHGFCA